MKQVILLLILMTPLSSVDAQVSDSLLVAEKALVVERIERSKEGNAETPPGYRLSATIPAELAKQIKAKTDIECGSVGMCVRLIEKKGVAFVAGDEFSLKGKAEIAGKALWKHDLTCKFSQLFHASSKSKFMAEGAFRFQNNTNDNCVYVVCRTTGKLDKDGKPEGTCEWIGPIEVDKFNMSSISTVFFDKLPGKK